MIFRQVLNSFPFKTSTFQKTNYGGGCSSSFLAEIDYAADLCLEYLLRPLHQGVGERGFLNAAGQWRGYGCGGLGGAFSGNNHEARRSAQALKFLSDDFLGRGIHRKGEHLFADSRYFDAQTGGIEQPCSGAEQLRRRVVAGMNE